MLDNLFLGEFFDELFLNKGGREFGAVKLPKGVFLLDIGGSILDTLRYCEKFRDLGFGLILYTIFSRLIPIHD